MSAHNAPVKKIQAHIDEGLWVEEGDTLVVAQYLDGYLYEAPGTGEIKVEQPQYLLSYHNGPMPAYYTETFHNIHDLARAMRQIADLRRWRVRRE